MEMEIMLVFYSGILFQTVFVCMDVREAQNYHGASFEAVLKIVPSLLLRGGSLVIVGNIHQLLT